MAHITVPEGAPGIVGPLLAYPGTAAPLAEFTQILMQGPSSLTIAERELIGAYVSSQNECRFCTYSHAATARHLYGTERGIVDQVLADFRTAPISEKLKALLAIAGKVQQGGRRVTDEDVAKARAEGADDKAIHDTVLIAAAFCMFNRYVDGLATWAPDDPALYDQRVAERGTSSYTQFLR
jgi:uncharacterized peroxidase-related enzyme